MTITKLAAECANDVMTAVQSSPTFFDSNSAAKRIQVACDQSALAALAKVIQSLENHRLIATDDPLVLRLIEETNALKTDIENNVKSALQPKQ